MRWWRYETPALIALLASGAALRFWRLDLMEFKADEANACRLALHVLGYTEPGVGRFFPTAGLASSVGIPNPPLFPYLMAIPLAVVRSPLAAAAAVAAANVVAIWLTYVAGKRCFSRFVGVSSAALLAFSPWGIVFSRKIWAQDLLPLCTAIFVLQLHALLVRRSPRAGMWLIVVAAAATQLHFSAWVLVIVAAFAIFLERRAVSWRWVAAGVAIAIVGYAPFLAYHASEIVHTAATHHRTHAALGVWKRFGLAWHYMVRIVGGGGMGYLIGKQSTFASVVSSVLGIAAIGGTIATLRVGGAPVRRLGLVFSAWYALPLLVLTALPVRSYMHYFIILMPLPYFGIARLLELALPRRPRVAAVAAAVCLASFGVIDVLFFDTIARDGGAPGDYGIAYKYKQQAADFIRRRTSGLAFRLGHDSDFKQVRSLVTIRYLIWNGRATPPVRRASDVNYVVIDRFGGAPPLLRSDRLAPSYARARFGPLTLVMIPRRG